MEYDGWDTLDKEMIHVWDRMACDLIMVLGTVYNLKQYSLFISGIFHLIFFGP